MWPILIVVFVEAEGLSLEPAPRPKPVMHPVAIYLEYALVI